MPLISVRGGVGTASPAAPAWGLVGILFLSFLKGLFAQRMELFLWFCMFLGEYEQNAREEKGKRI